ncbi:mediator of RNA polymerase II transcription subunit 13-like isoform X1 [Lethenteron reissneri]|uniref:mediator of RNA polymerase II transcription subunit 13-like isoform X1 n=1 Tax=Lethenteron reissneri TaxID=7753 RepID=UPI002AB70C11|nr:mediator of RNA polymerase II transcription subunit 13-like isoform X1 [Lethenteron reissneri]
MTAASWVANGASLEDCHSNLFSLADLTGIKWRRYTCGLGASGPVIAAPAQEDPILHSFVRSLQTNLLAVWRRNGSPGLKELWVYWWGDQPNLGDVIHPELRGEEEGSWDNGLTYECRTLLFKAIHNLLERCLFNKSFVRIGKWFVKPYERDEKPVQKSEHLSCSFSFFLHGDSNVCTSVEICQHAPLYRLDVDLLDLASASSSPLNVILSPYGLNAVLTGQAYKRSDASTRKLIEEWQQFYPVVATSTVGPGSSSGWDGMMGAGAASSAPGGGEDGASEPMQDEDAPVAVEVLVGGVRMVFPAALVLVPQSEALLLAPLYPPGGARDPTSCGTLTPPTSPPHALLADYCVTMPMSRSGGPGGAAPPDVPGGIPSAAAIAAAAAAALAAGGSSPGHAGESAHKWANWMVEHSWEEYNQDRTPLKRTRAMAGSDDDAASSKLTSWDFLEPSNRTPCCCSRHKVQRQRSGGGQLSARPAPLSGPSGLGGGGSSGPFGSLSQGPGGGSSSLPTSSSSTSSSSGSTLPSSKHKPCMEKGDKGGGGGGGERGTPKAARPFTPFHHRAEENAAAGAGGAGGAAGAGGGPGTGSAGLLLPELEAIGGGTPRTAHHHHHHHAGKADKLWSAGQAGGKAADGGAGGSGGGPPLAAEVVQSPSPLPPTLSPHPRLGRDLDGVDGVDGVMQGGGGGGGGAACSGVGSAGCVPAAVFYPPGGPAHATPVFHGGEDSSSLKAGLAATAASGQQQSQPPLHHPHHHHHHQQQQQQHHGGCHLALPPGQELGETALYAGLCPPQSPASADTRSMAAGATVPAWSVYQLPYDCGPGFGPPGLPSGRSRERCDGGAGEDGEGGDCLLLLGGGDDDDDDYAQADEAEAQTSMLLTALLLQPSKRLKVCEERLQMHRQMHSRGAHSRHGGAADATADPYAFNDVDDQISIGPGKKERPGGERSASKRAHPDHRTEGHGLAPVMNSCLDSKDAMSIFSPAPKSADTRPRSSSTSLMREVDLRVSFEDLENLFDNSSDDDMGVRDARGPLPAKAAPPGGGGEERHASREGRMPPAPAPAMPPCTLSSADLQRMFPTPPSLEQHPAFSPVNPSCKDYLNPDSAPGQTLLDPHGPPMAAQPAPFRPEIEDDMGSPKPEELKDFSFVFRTSRLQPFVGSSMFAPLKALPSGCLPPVRVPDSAIYRPSWTLCKLDPAMHALAAPYIRDVNLPSVGSLGDQDYLQMSTPQTGTPLGGAGGGGSNGGGGGGGGGGVLPSPATPRFSTPNPRTPRTPRTPRGPGGPASIPSSTNYNSAGDLYSPAASTPSTFRPVNSVEPPATTGQALPEAHSLYVTLILSDTVLNLFRDRNFDSCCLCACNMNIKGADVGLYLPDPGLEIQRRCSCGFSAVVNRRLGPNAGLFLEDELDIVGGPLTEFGRAAQRRLECCGQTDADGGLRLGAPDILDSASQDTATLVSLLEDSCNNPFPPLGLVASPSPPPLPPPPLPGLPGLSALPGPAAGPGGADALRLDLSDGSSECVMALEAGRQYVDNPSGGRMEETAVKGTLLHHWPERPAVEVSSLSSQDVVRLLGSLQPVLQDAIQKKRTGRSWENVQHVQGPLTWQQFHKMAGRGSYGTEESPEPLPIPHLLVGYDRDCLMVSPFSLPFWDKLLLEPFGSPRDIAYVVVCPENDALLHGARNFFRDLSTVYENCRLGLHRPITKVLRDGIMRVGRSAAQKVSEQPVDEWFSQNVGPPGSAAHEAFCKLRLFAQVCRHRLGPHLATQQLDSSLLAQSSSQRAPPQQQPGASAGAAAAPAAAATGPSGAQGPAQADASGGAGTAGGAGGCGAGAAGGPAGGGGGGPNGGGGGGPNGGGSAVFPGSSAMPGGQQQQASSQASGAGACAQPASGQPTGMPSLSQGMMGSQSSLQPPQNFLGQGSTGATQGMMGATASHHQGMMGSHQGQTQSGGGVEVDGSSATSQPMDVPDSTGTERERERIGVPTEGGSLEVPVPPAVVVYIVDPFTSDEGDDAGAGGGGPDDPALSASVWTLGLLRCYLGMVKHLPKHMRDAMCVQVVPSRYLLQPVRLEEHPLHVQHLKSLAFSVYAQCRRPLPHPVSIRTLTGFGPAAAMVSTLRELERPERLQIYSPPFILAPVKDKQTELGETFGEAGQKHNVLFVGYCLSHDQRWLLAACTDLHGELLETAIINIHVPNRSRRGKVACRRFGLNKLWEWCLGVMQLTSIPWRVVIGRLGRVGHGELKDWHILLGRRALQSSSRKLKETCRMCGISAADSPSILSACLVAIEPQGSFFIMPDSVSTGSVFGRSTTLNLQTSQLSTPQDASCTHILVFPTSAAMVPTPNFNPEHLDFNSNNEVMDILEEDIFDLSSVDPELSQLINLHPSPTASPGSPSGSPSGPHGDAPYQHGQGAGKHQGGERLLSAESHEEVTNLLQQPLALGYYVSTAPAAPLPQSFWASCPQAQQHCPLFLKASLHLHVTSVQSDELLLSKLSHPLDSSRTSDVLRFVLEHYNALSWLSCDPATQDRRSCLPVHLVVLTQLYNTFRTLL